MICPRCHNQNPNLFVEIEGKYYCRKCISFKRIEADTLLENHPIQYTVQPCSYQLQFELSETQKVISKSLKENFLKGINSYCNCVTSSGKTEIVFETIAEALSMGKRVCFCLPRTELTKELYERIRQAFPTADLGLFYGGKKENENAQFIICTTHQLYRFVSSGFDLMILDEVDAFPYYGNEVLNHIFNQCLHGSFIKLSATFLDEDIENGQVLNMHRRYHGHTLPIPSVIYCPLFLQKYMIAVTLLFSSKQWIIFAPTIKSCEKLLQFIYLLPLRGGIVTSKTEDNTTSILQLKSGYYKYLISTTILERGITIKDIQVMVYNASHTVFDHRTLIQIAGRVGRNPQYYKGRVLFFTSLKTDGIKKCIQKIKYHNNVSSVIKK